MFYIVLFYIASQVFLSFCPFFLAFGRACEWECIFATLTKIYGIYRSFLKEPGESAALDWTQLQCSIFSATPPSQLWTKTESTAVFAQCSKISAACAQTRKQEPDPKNEG